MESCSSKELFKKQIFQDFKKFMKNLILFMMPLKEKKIMKESICNKNQMQN